MCQRQPAMRRALFAALVCLSTTGLAQAQIGAIGKCGDGCGCPCVPKTDTWGFYQTQWHQWPGSTANSPLRRGPEIIGLPPIDAPRKETETDRPGGSQPSLGGPKSDILDRPRVTPQTGPDRTLDRSPEKMPDRTPMIPKGPNKGADENPFGSMNHQLPRGAGSSNLSGSTYGTANAPFTPNYNSESSGSVAPASAPSSKIARPNPLREDRTASASSAVSPAHAANSSYEGAKIGTIIPDAINGSATGTARPAGFSEPAPLRPIMNPVNSQLPASTALPKPQAPPAAPRQLTPIAPAYYDDNPSVGEVQRAFNSNPVGTAAHGEQSQFPPATKSAPNPAGPAMQIAPSATPFTDAPVTQAARNAAYEALPAAMTPASGSSAVQTPTNSQAAAASRPAVKPRANPLRNAEAAVPADAQPANVEQSPASPKMQPRPNPLRAVELDRKSDVTAATWVDDVTPAKAAVKSRANPLREGASIMASDSMVAPAVWIDDSADSGNASHKKLPKFQQ